MILLQGQLTVLVSAYSDMEVIGNIKKVTEDDIVIEVKNPSCFKTNWDILALIVSNIDVYEFHSRITDITDNFITIERPQSGGLSCIEKRKFTRADCNIGFIGMPVPSSNRQIPGLKDPFSGTVRNISAGGIMAVTNVPLPADFVFDFKLRVKRYIECKTVVRRVNKNDNIGLYEVGCEFLNMSLDDVKDISMFVFMEQLKTRKRELREHPYK